MFLYFDIKNWNFNVISFAYFTNFTENFQKPLVAICIHKRLKLKFYLSE